ncbi:MAG UNVERIFIED_CONTAM: ComEC family competence protein [Planctomycetaceae bacterium]
MALKESVNTIIRGTVSGVKYSNRGAQVTISEVIFGDLLTEEELPSIVKISVKNNDAKNITLGDYVEVSVFLSPPSRSIIPGGYDFGLYSYFKSIGASGYAIGEVKILHHPIDPFENMIYRVRKYIYYRLISLIGKDLGNFAAALLIGEQGGLDKKIMQDMRFAGVSHVLCVSGLHLSLVAGLFFLYSRILLNLSNRIAWNYNIKKIAAIISIIGSYIYLLISSAGVASVRAFIMTSLLMLAILYDRKVFSMRSVTIAAMIILTLNPEYVLHPSFQLSFVAVLSLIGGFEYYTKNKLFASEKYMLWDRLKLGFCSNLYSTFLASFGTTPFVLYHFYIMSNYSIIANLLIVPLITFAIMPLGVIALVLMPFQLDYYPILLMGYFIKPVIKIADYITALKGSVYYFGHISGPSLLLYIFGLFWLIIWESKIRRLGVGIIILAFSFMCFTRQPDVIFDAHEEFLAFKNTEGKLVIWGNNISKFYQSYLSNWFGQEEVIYNDTELEDHNYLITTSSGQKVSVNYNDTSVMGDFILNMSKDRSFLESIGALIIYCTESECDSVHEKKNRFKFQVSLEPTFKASCSWFLLWN